jgi:hypothetical protein
MKIHIPAQQLETFVNENKNNLEHSSYGMGAHFPVRCISLLEFIDIMGSSDDKLLDPIYAASMICIDKYINATIIPETSQIIVWVGYDQLFEVLLENNMIQEFGYTNQNLDEFKTDSGILFISLLSGFMSESVYIWGCNGVFDFDTYSDYFNHMKFFCNRMNKKVFIDRPKRKDVVQNILVAPGRNKMKYQ